jgi:hypothetical protein
MNKRIGQILGGLLVFALSACGSDGDFGVTQGKDLGQESAALSEMCTFECLLSGEATYHACRLAGVENLTCEQAYDEGARSCASKWCGATLTDTLVVPSAASEWVNNPTPELLAEASTNSLTANLDVSARPGPRQSDFSMWDNASCAGVR